MSISEYISIISIGGVKLLNIFLSVIWEWINRKILMC